jgi:hypothetical protein
MSAIRVSTVIDAEAAAAWARLEPIERHVDWMADAEAITFEGEQTRGVGTRFVCATRVGPIHLADRMVITEWVPLQAMGVRHEGVVTGTGRFTLEAAPGGGTVFAWQEDVRFPWWLGGRAGERAGGRPVLRALWGRNLARFKALVEADLAHGGEGDAGRSAEA